jgi:hypothetical protein
VRATGVPATERNPAPDQLGRRTAPARTPFVGRAVERAMLMRLGGIVGRCESELDSPRGIRRCAEIRTRETRSRRLLSLALA